MTWSRRKVNQNVAMRKIRIIYNDPDATDSSSDEQSNNYYCKRVKRAVREVYIPMYNSSEESAGLSSVGLSSVGAGRSKKIKGVRRREGGKFCAEIRDPIKNRKIWIGTYSTEAAAHEAYRLKEAEINRKMLALHELNLKTTALCSGPSLNVVKNVQGSSKDTIRPVDKLVVKDEVSDVKIELSDVKIEDDPRLSPLPDHYRSLDSRHDFREPTVKKFCDCPSASLTDFDDSMFDYEEDLLQLQVENRSPIWSPLPGFEWGKEELNWFNSL